MSNTQLENVLIIGGSHGITFEITRQLLSAGINVTAMSRTPGQLEELPAEQKDHLTHVVFDVIKDEIPNDAIPSSLDGFVFGPGSINLGGVRNVKSDRLMADLELNVVAAVRCFQAAMPALRAESTGSAVFFSTVAVNHGVAMHSYIAAAKGALQALAKTWAAELAPAVRVNCVAPALTETPLSKNLLSTDEKRSAMAEKYPLGRVGQPTDIAAAAIYLLSPQSNWVTGQVLPVDGGMSSVIRL